MSSSRVIGVLIILIILLSGCSKEISILGPKKNISDYSEKTFKIEEPLEIDLESDSGNIEVFCWDKNEAKLEITKRIKGVKDKNTLEKNLKSYDVYTSFDKNKLSIYTNCEKQKSNPTDRSIDLKIYIPKRINKIKCKLDFGKLKIYDDLRCNLDLQVDMANTDINKFEGTLNFKGEMGNLRISEGRITGPSSAVVNMGNIDIKAELIENGTIYEFSTGVGNINLSLPSKSKLCFQSIGSVGVNQFEPYNFPTKVNINSNMGKVSVEKYSLD